jgi:hypothetical protein
MCENNETAGLNDTLGAEVVIKHWIGVDRVAADGTSPSVARQRSRQLNSPPAMLFAVGESWPHPAELGSIKTPLPDNVELTTLEHLSETGNLLVRLTHIYPPGEHHALSATTTVDLTNTFPTLSTRVSGITEMYASADAALTDVERLEWRSNADESDSARLPQRATRSAPSMTAIQLESGETRTFVLTVHQI